jgi:hypothetical protein
MQLQISKEGEDFVRWPHTKNGIYSIKSAYNFARSDNFFASRSRRGGGSSSMAAYEEKHWKMVLKIKAPGKMKIQLWRFAHDCLPTGVQMVRRHIPTTDICVFCGRVEDVEHVFLQCQFANEVWRLVKNAFSIQLNRRDFMSPKFWLFSFLERASELEATVLAVTCWYIWEARNDARNDKQTPDPKCSSLRIISYVHMIVEHCYKTSPAFRCESNRVQKWTPPPVGEVLVNVDSALFPGHQRMAVGAVFRDHAGECVLVISEPLRGFTCSEMAEALALQRVVIVAVERGYGKVIFASDCLSLIQRLLSSKPDRSLVGAVVADIKLKSRSFSSVFFRHVKRSLNEAAHILARSVDVTSLGFISISAPDSIRKTLCIDIM